MKTTRQTVNFEIVTGNVFTVPDFDALVVPAQQRTDWDPREGLGVEAEVYRRLGDAEGASVQRKRRAEKAEWEPAECFVTEIKTKIAVSAFSRLIHVVPPMYRDENWETGLYLCYFNAMKTAFERGFKSVLFPLLGAGRNNVPDELSMYLAEEAYTNLVTMVAKEKRDTHALAGLKVCVVRFDGEKPKFGHGQGLVNHYEDLKAENVRIVYVPKELDYSVFYFRKEILQNRSADSFTRDQLKERCGYGPDRDTSFNEYVKEPIYGVVKTKPQPKIIRKFAKGLMLSADQVNAVLRDLGIRELEDSERLDFARIWGRPGDEKVVQNEPQRGRASEDRDPER